MTLKNTKTILFASLIVAMILPFSGMNFAEAKKTDILDDKKYWLELFKEKHLANQSIADQNRYTELLVTYLENRIPEQVELDKEIEVLSRIALESKANGKAFEKSQAFNKQVEKIRGLDIVKSADYINSLPDGSSDIESSIASQLSNKIQTTSTSTTEPTIHYVSSEYNPPITYTTFSQGVKLGHGAYVSYPLFDLGGVIINGLAWNTTSNANEEWRSVSAISLETGKFELVSEVCLNNKGSMNSVSFEQTSNSYITSSINIILYTDYDVIDKTFYWYTSTGSCHVMKDTVSNISAGSTGNQLSGLQDVNVN